MQKLCQVGVFAKKLCKGNTFMAENARLPNKILYFCTR